MNVCVCPSSSSSTLRFKDLVPVLYQEGRHQGDPVTLGVGGFGRVQLVRACARVCCAGVCVHANSPPFDKEKKTLIESF